MPVPTDITAGTITLTNGSTAFTGTGTGWLASDIREGDLIIWLDGGEDYAPPIIASIETNTAGTLISEWVGPTLTGVNYRIRYQWDSSRVSAQSRQLIDQLGNGNIQALAGLTGPGVPVFTGPHAMTVKPEADFINGVYYDIQVDTLAERAAYDAQAEGYSVLISDMGDGRSAITSKNSNTTGDWSDPAYLTGEVGPMPTLEVGDTTTGLPGTDADVVITPVLGGYELDFTLPEGRGFNPRGLYNPATAYLVDDLVTDSKGVQWRAKINTTGNAPPSLPTTSNTQWELFAGVQGLRPRGLYNPATAYLIDDLVLDSKGAQWRAIADTTGNAPPSLPTTTNTWWELFAGVRGLIPRGLYNPVTAYTLDDLVTDSKGVQWHAIASTTGNAPPTLPTTTNTWWELFAGVRGINPRGTYSGVTAYLSDDIVLDNGSTWRAKINTTGNAPPTLPTTSNTQWELLAAKGTDGTGTGDVVGPASAINNRIAVFDGTTGKLIKDGGSGATMSDITTAINAKASVGKAIAMALVFGG